MFVRHHNVAETEQFDGKLDGWRRVEDGGRTSGAPCTEGIGDCIERDLELAEHDQRGDRVGSDHRGVGTRDYHDAVLAVVIDSDQRPAGRHIVAVDELREVDAFNLGN